MNAIQAIQSTKARGLVSVFGYRFGPPLTAFNHQALAGGALPLIDATSGLAQGTLEDPVSDALLLSWL